MTYVSLSRNEGISTSLAVSKDGLNWERKGIIFGEQDKDVVLFPEKIKDKYIAFDRPEGNFDFSPPHIWIAYSKNILNWGGLKSLRFSKEIDSFSRCGAGPPPIKTKKGWLFLFHSVTHPQPSGFLINVEKFLGKEIKPMSEVYSVWASLLDLTNPEKQISASKGPIIIPKKKYEVSFEGKRVVFPTGIITDEKEKYILLYSGAGDTYVTVKKIKLSDIFEKLDINKSNPILTFPL